MPLAANWRQCGLPCVVLRTRVRNRRHEGESAGRNGESLTVENEWVPQVLVTISWLQSLVRDISLVKAGVGQDLPSGRRSTAQVAAN
jgi:hypothetical protein